MDQSILVSTRTVGVHCNETYWLTSLGRSSMFSGMDAMLDMSMMDGWMVLCKEAIRPFQSMDSK